MKHGKYSKTKEVKPYKIVETIKRYDGISTNEYFCKTKENAEKWINLLKSLQPNPNEYYFGSDFEIVYIGTEKYI